MIRSSAEDSGYSGAAVVELPGSTPEPETAWDAGRVNPRIKKIPSSLRKGRPGFPQEPLWHRRLLRRLREDSQFLRTVVQFAFVLLCLWIGLEFHLFMAWGMSGGSEQYVSRPPGVEGFLPISALISLKYWLVTGIINSVHPAALIILLAIITISVLLKKAFCSWLCPVGTLSESLWMLGEKVFGRNLRVPRWLDYPLRSLKYFLLLFFSYSIWEMDIFSLQQFIFSPYNKVADLKMYLFFANISTFALWTILILMALSVVIKNFWCRYLCPYGALLGALSLLSPVKITRKKETCIDCSLCTKVCPANIKVHSAGRVWSDECTSCLKCVQICPVVDTLELKTSSKSKAIPAWVFGVLVTGVFVAVTGLAMLTGHWQNGIPREEYLRRFQNLHMPVYQHNQGSVPEYGPQD